MDSIKESITKESLPTLKSYPTIEGKKVTNKPPKVHLFKRVHEFIAEAPWCTYALQHESSVAASSLTTADDRKKFKFRKVPTRHLFIGCNLTETNAREREALEGRVTQYIKHCTRVVPYPVIQVIQQKCFDVEKTLLEDVESGLKEEESTARLMECVKQQRLCLLTLVRDIRGIQAMDVRKEGQRNDFLNQFLEDELKALGLVIIKNHYSIFGRSRPDLAFYMQEKTWIGVGVVMQQEEVNVNLHGAAVEFKMDIPYEHSSLLPQAFANMVQVSNNMVIDALERGKIVDTVTVYGLLVAHDKDYTVPLKYFVDFGTNMYKMEVGENDSFGKVFSLVVFIGLLGANCD